MGDRDADLSQVFPLEGLLRRHAWLGPVLLALVVVAWLCLDGRLEAMP